LPVHLLVGPGKQGAEGGVLLLQERIADADRELIEGAAIGIAPVEQLMDLPGERDGFGLAAAGEQNGKFVAADAGQKSLSVGHGGFERVRGADERQIALHVAAGVVDALEPVDVQHHQTDTAVFVPVFPQPGGVGVEAPAVVEPGERVGRERAVLDVDIAHEHRKREPDPDGHKTVPEDLQDGAHERDEHKE